LLLARAADGALMESRRRFVNPCPLLGANRIPGSEDIR